MRQDASEMREVYILELWRRANTPGDPQAWQVFQHCLEETVLSWFHDHPSQEAACHLYSKRYFVVLAFERLRQALSQRQGTCETLSEVLAYLRACLNGVILEALRISSCPQAESSYGSAEQDLQGNHGSLEMWNWVQATLSSIRERRLAYLLYHCGLKPAEIVRAFPHEWSDVCEVAHVRCIVFERLTKELICDGHTFV